MLYKRIPSELTPEKRVTVLISVLFFNLMLISSQIILKNRQSLLQNVLATLIAPVQMTVQRSSAFVSHFFQRYLFLTHTFEKYQQLREKNIVLRYQNFRLQKEIYELRAWRRSGAKYEHFVLANVIYVDSNFPYNSIQIDKGSKDGIRADMTALNIDGELVGRVVRPVSLFSCSIRLLTSAAGGTGAYIGSNKLEGLLVGNNSSLCTFKYLMESKPVNPGETVITSGTDLLYFPYIPIGRVTKVEKDYLMKKVLVKPFFVEKSIKQLILVGRE